MSMKREKTASQIRFLTGFIKKGALLYVIGSILRAVKDLLESVLNGQLYRVVIGLSDAGKGLDAWKDALFQMGMLGVFLMLVAGMLLAGEMMVMKVSLGADRAIRRRLSERICRMPERLRTEQNVGYWTNLFGRDVEITGDSYKTKWGLMLSRIISIVGGTAILLRYDLSMALFTLFCGGIYFLMIYGLKSKAKTYQQKTFAVLGKLSQLLGEISLGLPLIRFYQLKDRYNSRYQNASEESRQIGLMNARVSTLALGLRNFGYSFSYVGILIFGLALVDKGRIGMADFMYLWSIGIGVAYGMQSLGTQLLEYQETQAAVGRVMEGYELPEEFTGTKKVLGAAIRLKNVSFGYTSDKPVLRGLDLTIPKGQKVAIVGTSGGGKTTLIRLLMGLYQPDEGEICMGGVSTKEAELHSLRSHFAYLPQQPFLFDESIRKNLQLINPSATEEELQKAADKAGLTELIKKLPEGLDTQVGENGSHLSGGERQRIGLARCYLKEADIYVMDEMTSALDARLEEEIIKKLFSMQDKTVICITHKLAAARQAERILVFDQGKIVEDGSHEQLLALGGVYNRLNAAERT